MKKQISFPIALTIIIICALVALFTVYIYSLMPNAEEKPITETKTETDGWEIYRNETLGFEIKYPGYLTGVRYDETSFESIIPLKKSNTRLFDKSFIITVREEEYEGSTQYYCDQGIPHTSIVNFNGVDFCKVRSTEEGDGNLYSHWFSYFTINNKKWITLGMKLTYCVSQTLGDECSDLEEFDKEQKEKELDRLVSNFKIIGQKETSYKVEIPEVREKYNCYSFSEETIKLSKEHLNTTEDELLEEGAFVAQHSFSVDTINNSENLSIEEIIEKYNCSYSFPLEEIILSGTKGKRAKSGICAPGGDTSIAHRVYLPLGSKIYTISAYSSSVYSASKESREECASRLSVEFEEMISSFKVLN